MTPGPLIARQRRVMLAKRVAIGLAMAALLLTQLRWAGAAMPIDCTVRPLERIASGTKVADGPPNGWSHLVFKTHSQLAAGDVETLPEFAKSLAQFLFTVMTARVSPYRQGDRQLYRLEHVAIGVGTRIGQHDVVISSETQADLGANLGPFKQIILGRAEEHLKKVTCVAASDSMRIVDAPTIMHLDGLHRSVVFRYLFLADPESGQLASLVWRIDLDASGSYQPGITTAVLVQQNLVVTSPLHVDGNKVFHGIPGADAFAVTRLPPGTRFNLPAAAQRVAGLQQFAPETAGQLERALRQIVRFNGAE